MPPKRPRKQEEVIVHVEIVRSGKPPTAAQRAAGHRAMLALAERLLGKVEDEKARDDGLPRGQ